MISPYRISRPLGLLLTLALLLLPVAAVSGPVLAMPARQNERPTPDPIILSQIETPEGVQTTVQIYASQDTYISSTNPNTNYGSSTSPAPGLGIGYSVSNPATGAMRMLIKYNFDGIPSNAVINSATAYFYETSYWPQPDSAMAVQAQLAYTAWGEYSATWNNANFIGGSPLPIGYVNAALGWQAFDVTNVVKTWVSGSAANNGVIVTGDESPSNDRSRYFASRETGTPPYIIVGYTTQCDTYTPVATVNALPAYSPSSFTVSWSGYDTAPPGCSPSGIAYYDVYYQLNNGAFVDWLGDTTATSATFSGQPNGTIVGFRARAVDNAGNAQPIGNAQAWTTVDSQPPVASVNPLPQYTTSSSFWVTWGGTDNLSGIAYYDVQYNKNGTGWQTLIARTPQTSYFITGATTGDDYEFRARATDNVGNAQAWSSSAQAATTVWFNTIVVIQTFNPPILQSTAPVTETFTVNWAGYAPPGSNITSYSIYYSFNNGPFTQVIGSPFPGSQTSATFNWFTTGNGDGNYTFKGTAVSSPNYPPLDVPQLQRTMIVDMAGKFNVRTYLPIIAQNSGN